MPSPTSMSCWPYELVAQNPTGWATVAKEAAAVKEAAYRATMVPYSDRPLGGATANAKCRHRGRGPLAGASLATVAHPVGFCATSS